MTFCYDDLKYMRRALQLARSGRGHVSPNPMVGAVIAAPDGRIIGEGWHRRFGGPHAEVNAVRSVAEEDLVLLPESTIYVTLEPCSHYGKTPPCAKLLVDCHVKRVVVGAGDPNPKVAGRGIAMLRQAGIRVDEHCLEDECKALNVMFMTAHTLHRPYITLKWACSSDGYMDAERGIDGKAYRFSEPRGAQTVHWRRVAHDAIAVGACTAIADNPGLDARLFDGHSPRPVLFDRHRLVMPGSCRLADRADLLRIDGRESLRDVLHRLYADENITSMLVEGGSRLLSSFIKAGLWDEAWIEVAPISLGASGCVRTPSIDGVPASVENIGDNVLLHYLNKLYNT